MLPLLSVFKYSLVRRGGLRRGILMGVALGGAVLCTASAAAQTPDPADAAAPTVTPREIIDRLISDRPGQGAERGIAPRPAAPRSDGAPAVGTRGPGLDPAVVQIDPDAPLPRLRREGGFVVERPGRLIAVPNPAADQPGADALWVFAYDRVAGVDDLRPMIMQKTQRLQLMQDGLNVPRPEGQDLAAARGRLVGHFLISGQVHTHRGVNYLLPSAVTARPDAATRALLDAGRAPRRTVEPTSQDAAPRRGAVVNDAFESPEGGGGATFAGADDPIARMESLLTRPSGAAATPEDPRFGPVAEGVDPDAAGDGPFAAAPRQEGSYLIERRGRLVSQGRGRAVLFTFSADGVNADEPPMVLMPCRLLEELENDVRQRDTAPEFTVSGRVYAYRGVNHLLPTSYRTVPRRDNLGG